MSQTRLRSADRAWRFRRFHRRHEIRAPSGHRPGQSGLAGPPPCSAERSTPACRAMLRASGLAGTSSDTAGKFTADDQAGFGSLWAAGAGRRLSRFGAMEAEAAGCRSDGERRRFGRVQNGQHLAHIDLPRPGWNHDPGERASLGRFQVHGRLVNFDLGDDLAGSHRLSLPFSPGDDSSLGHRIGQARHADLDGHERAPIWRAGRGTPARRRR